MQTVRKQFESETFKMLPPKEFRFKGSDDDAKLKLEFSRNVDGWTIARECFNEEVCSLSTYSLMYILKIDNYDFINN